jgi:penicillin-binding protein 1A
MTKPRESRQKAPAQPRRSLLGRTARWALKWAAVAVIWVAIIVAGILAYYATDLPDIREASVLKRRPAITVLAADNSTIARFGDLQGQYVTVKSLPPHLVNAVLAIEDRRFYSHFGVDPVGLVRAAWTNWRADSVVQGGSTITQQLAKNLFLTPERALKRKIQEAMLALWLERRYSKDEILAAYLNSVYLGAGTYGVEAAAQTYFGKPAAEVTLREAAILAGLLKAPSRYSPLNRRDRAIERAEVVLAAMQQGGFITEAEMATANAAKPVPRRKPGSNDSVRYFADWVVDQVDDFIGAVDRDLIVTTTLQPPLQRAADARIAGLFANPAAAKAGIGQASLLSMRPDGAVVAMVGGRDYGASQFNRVTQGLRQPGSSFKPFVYLAALEYGLTPYSMVEDAPIRVRDWTPENFDGRYRGMITLREALVHSINTAAVRVLDQIGFDRAHSVAQRLGISSKLGRDLSLALGTSEVTMLELATAFTTLGNGGSIVMAYGITEIRDRDGRVLYQRQGAGAGRAVEPAVLTELTEMMAGVVREGTGRGAALDRPAAGKTGTSQMHRDAWFAGFTADFTTVVWVGNDDNTPMNKVTGGSFPATVWRQYMADAHQGLPPRPLPGLEGGPRSYVSEPRVVGPSSGGAFGRLLQGLTQSQPNLGTAPARSAGMGGGSRGMPAVNEGN